MEQTEEVKMVIAYPTYNEIPDMSTDKLIELKSKVDTYLNEIQKEVRRRIQR